MLTGLFLLIGCGDGGNQASSSSSGSTGGMGQPPLEIERPANAIEGQYLFFFDSATVTPEMVKGVAEELLAKHGGTLMDLYEGGIIGFSAKDLDDEKAQSISTDIRVASLGQNGWAELFGIQANPPSWGLDRIDQVGATLNNAYENYRTGKDVHVYVIDSGIRSTHQEFTGRIGPGISFIPDGNGTEDCHGHGTHVAGTIGGTSYGVAKGVTLHPVRIAGCNGVPDIGGLLAGIAWVTQNQIKPAVINLSGGTSKYSMLDTAAQQAVSAGVVFVAAAGNPAPFGTLASEYSPGRAPEVINVGATGKDDATVLFTNYGSAIDIFAPGLDIVSAGHSGDTAAATKSGTSMAAPHVAGVVAQYLEQNPMATPAQTSSALYGGATMGVVVGDKTAANRLVFSRFYEPGGGFVNPNTWDTYYSDGGPWDESAAYFGTIQFPDINGDKMADVCGRAQNGIVCEVSTGTSFGPPVTWTPQFSDPSGWNQQESWWGTIRFPDLNGDGKADVCGRSSSGISCALSNGTSFDPITPWGPYYDDGGPWGQSPAYYGTIQYPDLNGDKMADVCGRAQNGIVCELSTGTTFGPPVTWTPQFSDPSGWNQQDSWYGTIRFPDINGDGKADVCGRSSSGISCALSNGMSFDPLTQWDTYYEDGGPWDEAQSYWRTIQFADINGDKMADVCGRAANGLVCELSTGTKFGPPVPWCPYFDDASIWPTGSHYWSTIQYLDVNGDGKADVCGRRDDGIFCGISTGIEFAYPGKWQPIFGDNNSWALSTSYWATIRFPDVNGDGRSDVCGRNMGGIVCATAP